MLIRLIHPRHSGSWVTEATMSNTIEVPARFISLKEFAQRSTLSRSEVYNMIAAGELPKPVRLGPNRVAFPETVWTNWAASKMAAAA